MNGLQLSLVESTLSAFLLALARTAAFILVSPPFSARNVAPRARVGLAVALALPMSAAVQGRAPELGSPGMLLAAVAEVLIGFTLGFLVLVAVATIQTVGELLDVVGGFTLSQAMDPLLQVQSSVLGRLHQLTAAALLFATDGHLLVLRGLSRTMEVGAVPLLRLDLIARAVTEDVAGLFLAAIQIAGPVIAAALVADVALGLLTRAAPAINPFALSFPLKIVLTLALAGLVLTRIPEALRTMVDGALGTMLDLVRAAGGG